MGRPARYADRAEAGEVLARALEHVPRGALVLGIPRGGVVVAAVVAERRGEPLDVVLARKLGAPGRSELAIGAVGPDGSVVLDERVLGHLGGVSREYIAQEALAQHALVLARIEAYGTGVPAMDLAGRCVIVVDDGVATGSTARACLRWLRGRGARPVILAVPVAPPAVAEMLAEDADQVVCPMTPPRFAAVGQWYRRFDEVADAAVIALLDNARGRGIDPATSS